MNSGVEDKRNLPAVTIACGFSTGVFLLDVVTPQGMAPHMLYAVSVLIAAWSQRERSVWLLALLCTGLTVLGAVSSPPGLALAVVTFNRLTGITLIWLTAVLAMLYLRTEERLRVLNARLEELVGQRTGELALAFENRERLSRNLHDDVLQLIYAAGLDLKTAKPPFKECPAETAQQIEQGLDRLELAMQRLRDYISGPQPKETGGHAFDAALAALVRDMSVEAGPRLSLNMAAGLSVNLSHEQADNLLHIVREALSNCIRHSRAKHGWVTVHKKNGTLRIEISDDGEGFDPGTARTRGHGLRNMMARAKDIGAELETLSAPRRGTQIVASVPCEE